MATYSIKDLETLSGIKAHTIRIWEQRYHLIEPKRTPTNIRFYTDEDLKYILNIAFLNKNGIRISQIAKMTREEVAKKVSNISKENSQNTNSLQSLTIAMVELNAPKIEELLHQHIEQSGWEQTILKIIVPFLEKLSLLWLTGSITMVHEQFMYNLLRQKVVAAIDRLPPAGASAQFLLYLPDGEGSELLLLLTQFLLRQRGFNTIYLGKGISLSDLELALELIQPQYILAAFNEWTAKQPYAQYFAQLSHLAKHATILLTGHGAADAPALDLPNIFASEDLYELVELLERVEQQAR